ncbi:MAG: thioredoxin domain-containing protein [Thaumarchaeota archaeon]|nr:thioredoxin domain-containing protein [Nitrososphaerota archaeon]
MASIEVSLPSMGIGAAIAAAAILAPLYALELASPDAPAMPAQLGVPSTGALEPPPAEPTPELLLSNASPFLGNPAAPVTLIEFGDYQCAFCHRHFERTEPTIVSEYVETGKVRMLFKDFVVIGPDSVTAARAAHCAGDQGLFWEFHDAIYEAYGGERTGWASLAGMRQIAGGVGGLDAGAWGSCMDAGTHEARIGASSADARALGLSGTPAFYVIGSDGDVYLMRGARPLAEFVDVLDRAIAG